jgi:hypothetical protein
MGEIVSSDVLEWARDLAVIRKLFAGEEITPSESPEPAIILQFAPRQRQQSTVEQDDALP